MADADATIALGNAAWKYGAVLLSMYGCLRVWRVFKGFVRGGL